MAPGAAVVETSPPLEALLRLREEGLRGFPRLETLAVRGDWRTRALAISAIGSLVREDATAWRGSWRHWGWYLPAVRRHFPTAGPRGSFVRGPLINGLRDRAWIVRAAAALAVGECRDRGLAPALEALLGDHQRAVRLAAAAALLQAGVPCPVPVPALLAGEAAPSRIGDTAFAREWLERLVRAHLSVVVALGAMGLAPLAPGQAAGWAGLLAGEEPLEQAPDPQAEVRRYAQEKEDRHNFTKPFTPGAREQNVWLLHSFLVLAEQMQVPQGARVLDLGGGAAWVSELLAKLGYRPVTLDLAASLLRIGKDRFIREHLPSRLVAGDMAALPFPDAQFEAVVVIDALHHVGDVGVVFREAHRVLARGGQFLLAEPGEGHAEAEKSRGEMSEHGVCEREIHLFEAVESGRAAGFDSVRVVPHYVPGVFFTPEELRKAMERPAETWRIHIAGSTGRFDEYLMQSMLSHPVLVFGKGERVLDSRAPRRLRARFEPRLQRRGTAVQGSVRVENVGDTRWIRGGDEPGCVRLGFQLMTPERSLLDLDFDRALLPADVPAGVEVEVPVALTLPEAATPYVLKIDMVDEHICWFEDVGSAPVYLAL